MKKRDLEIGDVVQLDPNGEKFPGFLVVVTEQKDFGCQGYLLHTGDFPAVRYKKIAYVRAKWSEMQYVGKVAWLRTEHETKNETEDDRDEDSDPPL